MAFRTLSLGVLAAAAPAALAGGTAGDFDLYLMATSWQPEFCYSGGGKYPGCDDPDPYWAEALTLHGVWPQYDPERSDPYPSNCDSDYGTSLNTTLAESMFDEINQYWPNVKELPSDDDGVKGYWEFLDHEWSKHGTCSGLTQEGYIQGAIDLLKQLGTPSIISDNVGQTVALDDIVAAYGGASQVAVGCDSAGKFLSDMYTCWDVDPDTFLPSSRRDCPDDVLAELSCGDDVTIPDFGQ